LFVFLIPVFGGGAYYLKIYQAKKIVPVPTPTQTISQVVPTSEFIDQVTPTSVLDVNPSTVDWKTYTSPLYNPFWSDEQLQKIKIGDGYATSENIKKIKFSIMHLTGWTQGVFDNANQAEFDGGSTGSSGFKFYKGDFEIRIGKYYAPGGNLCSLFPAGYEKVESFAPLQRFSAGKDEQTKTGFTKFYICSKENNQEYSSVTSIGQIIYLVPSTYRESDIRLMNSIVSTIQKLQ
jgi:hypothetical protein